MPTATTLHGSCHCGRLRIEIASELSYASIAPRACDCAFCRKHGAAWISDPAGSLSIRARAGALREYRQGSGNARFLLCRDCGVLVAATFTDGARLHGAANAGCLDGDATLAPAVAASPQTLDPEQKMARWRQAWFADVVLLTSTG